MLWLVARTDNVDYDEYDSWVVRAANADETVEAVWEVHGDSSGWSSLGHPGTLDGFRSRVAVTLLAVFGPPEIILGSFNAG